MRDFLFLVVLQHEMDDVPLRLFATFEEAEQFAKAADWDPPANIVKSLKLPDMTTPCNLVVIKFFDGIPCERIFIRNFEDETERLEEALNGGESDG